MIYTLTTNPAVDMNVNADTLTTKKVNRTRDAVYTPNGKGLNVSFTLTTSSARPRSAARCDPSPSTASPASTSS